MSAGVSLTSSPSQLARFSRSAFKPVVFIAALVPLCLIVGQLALGRTVDPVAFALNRLGFWTLTLLLATLSATPLRILLRSPWPMQVRRMLGLFTFFYASLHLLTYSVVDQGLDLAAIAADVSKRKFITVGFASFVMLVPLALTSTKAAVRRLGGRRWRRLHKLAYLAAAGGVVHFFWRVKADSREPWIFACVLGGLFAVRLLDALKRRFARARSSKPLAP
jgi:sulfoxide reductase heme-binding subunit YedZ